MISRTLFIHENCGGKLRTLSFIDTNPKTGKVGGVRDPTHFKCLKCRKIVSIVVTQRTMK